MAKRWKKQEITYLKRYADRRLLTELAERFRTKPAEVAERLKLLGLVTKDGQGAKPKRDDPKLRDFELGVKAMHKQRWKQAIEYFERVVEEAEQADLAGRARRYSRMCRARLAKSPAKQQVDPFLTAVFERNRGNLDKALELCKRGGRQSKDERFAYLAASIHALKDDMEKAAKFLSLAIDLNPKNRIHAFHDSDFRTLRKDPEHGHLFH